jgi:hypothetical protein
MMEYNQALDAIAVYVLFAYYRKYKKYRFYGDILRNARYLGAFNCDVVGRESGTFTDTDKLRGSSWCSSSVGALLADFIKNEGSK